MIPNRTRTSTLANIAKLRKEGATSDELYFVAKELGLLPAIIFRTDV